MKKLYEFIFRDASILSMAIAYAAGMAVMVGGTFFNILSGVFVVGVIFIHAYGGYKKF